MALLSIFAFLCLPMWLHDENVDCPPMYHVFIRSYTLTVGELKYCLFWRVLSALSFILWFFCPMALLFIFAFFCPKNVIAWWECWLYTPVSCDHGIVHLDCWSIKIFSLFGVFFRLEFYPSMLLSYGAFVHFCFSLSTHVIAWRECWLSTPVSCDHGIVHLDCYSIKICSLFGGFVRFEFYPLLLLSYGAFVHFCFSLSDHVIVWRECWLSTTVSHENGIVHLDCYSIKICSLFGEFCSLWVLSFGAFVLWRFCPFLLFSVHPRDCMTRMLIVHPCTMWSWDHTPWLL